MSKWTGLTINGAPHRPPDFNRVGAIRRGAGKSVQSAGKALRDNPVAYPAKLAREIQNRSGVLRGMTSGGVRLNLTTRADAVGGSGDRGYLYKQIVAMGERASSAVTPGVRMPFQASFARMMATERIKSDGAKTNAAAVFSSHPFVGFQPNKELEFGSSQHNQAQAALQQRFTRPDRFGMTPRRAYAMARNESNPRGPEALRRIAPFDGNDKQIQSPQHQDGRNVSRVLQSKNQRAAYNTDAQWDREYPKRA